MEVALICPTAFLEKVAKKSKFHMCLAPVALRDKEYEQFYRERSDVDDFVLLDNGVFEDGRSVPMDDFLQLARDVDPDELVIPDVLYESEATVRSAELFIHELESLCRGEVVHVVGQRRAVARKEASWPQLMAVPQGRSLKEWLWCYEHLIQMEHVTTIGLSCLSIPMSFGGDVMCSRIACCELLEARGLPTTLKRKQYHLLGCGNPLELVVHQNRRTWIRSCDTSSPFVSGVHGIRYSSLGLEVPKIQTKVNFNWEPKDFDKHQLTTVDYNVQWLLRHADVKA